MKKQVVLISFVTSLLVGMLIRKSVRLEKLQQENIELKQEIINLKNGRV